MAISAKGALVATGVAGSGALGIYGLTFLSSSEPVWKALKEDSGATNTYSSDKYAHHYQRFLVGVEKEENEPWWNWSFANRHQTTAEAERGDGFTSGIDSWEKLKEACKNAYGAGVTVTEGNITASGTPNTNYKEASTWKYCSSLGAQPVVLNASNEASEAEYKTTETTNPKWGKFADVNGKLVSTETKENAAFWEIQQKDLFENIDSGHAFFTNKKSLGVKEACKVAYAATKTDTSPSQAEILKYCSLKGQA